mmetsp:Transcript_111/g.191  ORF Transcript_111/g.191 Transcript_111/m.191 type:complete len:127 (-) Transcript_111:100-480(-)
MDNCRFCLLCTLSLTIDTCMQEKEESEKEPPSTTYTRLSVFQKLQEGIELCEDRSLPHIRSSALVNFLPKKPIKDKSPCTTSLPQEKERCWSSLMLNGAGERNEWGIVRSYFGSRTRQILNITQQA